MKYLKRAYFGLTMILTGAFVVSFAALVAAVWWLADWANRRGFV